MVIPVYFFSCPEDYYGNRCERFNKEEGGLDAGAITGIVFAVLAGLIIIALGIIYMMKKKR